jgi:hypothetical protein
MEDLDALDVPALVLLLLLRVSVCLPLLSLVLPPSLCLTPELFLWAQSYWPPPLSHQRYFGV